MAVYGLSTFLFGRMGKDEARNYGSYLGVFFMFWARFVMLIVNIVDVRGYTAKAFAALYVALGLCIIAWATYIHNKRKDDFIAEYEQKTRAQKFWVVAGLFGVLLLCTISLFTPIFDDVN